ncbi:putative uncharacterized protein [Mycolicibacterium canariasense]|uniref:Thymidylate synthase n=1 Tax=Mycolicibacterium canariasense TaxID=228230 RepID=A0A100WIM1_MYCCR|nr:hypothetical protein [Mycolicibacterium canariasense]MCV7211157.1 hypothetical protein [Mycolicibacterium canariasense]ORV09330.1 hypothetical protein AWB94_10110 [Mycolicibacterium canariasense]GAS98589.1 putative uncharacterized protein [Mycolicibacterium canariasense]
MTDFCYIEAPNLAAGWLDSILWVAAQPHRKAFHTVTRIVDASLDGSPRIHRAASDLLNEVQLPSVATVANTIFPAAMAAQTPDATELGVRYERVFPELQRLDRNNRNGTYFLRLVAYPGAAGTTTNQLQRIVSALNVELSTDGPKRARYEATLEIPADAPEPITAGIPVFEPSLDTSPMGFPCLSFLSFQHDCSLLHAVAHYRSQWLMQRGLGNYLGIARLQRYLAEQAGLTAGHLTVVVGHAHADHLRQDRIAALTALRQDLNQEAVTSDEATLPAAVH